MVGIVLEASDTVLPIPVDGLGEFRRGKLEAQGHGADSRIRGLFSRSFFSLSTTSLNKSWFISSSYSSDFLSIFFICLVCFKKSFSSRFSRFISSLNLSFKFFIKNIIMSTIRFNALNETLKRKPVEVQ